MLISMQVSGTMIALTRDSLAAESISVATFSTFGGRDCGNHESGCDEDSNDVTSRQLPNSIPQSPNSWFFPIGPGRGPAKSGGSPYLPTPAP